MKHLVFLSLCFCLAACSSDAVESERRSDLSRAAIEPAAGITYPEFRNHPMNEGGDYRAAQKRFMAMDRNNDGRLSPRELGEF